VTWDTNVRSLHNKVRFVPCHKLKLEAILSGPDIKITLFKVRWKQTSYEDVIICTNSERKQSINLIATGIIH